MPEDPISIKKAKNVATRAAGKAIRKLIAGDTDDEHKELTPPRAYHQTGDLSDAEHDPKDGWNEDVAVKHGHFLLLLKPQVALRSERDNSNIVAVGKFQLSDRVVRDTDVTPRSEYRITSQLFDS